ncbi:MAG TPA: D-alanyl-D-alanine carboxypeptidase family protein [Thermoanaerobaculia bacterium]|nr:D-alanyl-D-alanine carboxypeptidase family protein [Thermoanaerobaculia bacterium]
MKRWIAAVLIAGSASLTYAQTDGPGYTAAIIIEASSGRVLYERNANTPLPTASMAKMMTLLIAMDRVKEGSLKLDEPVPISARASKMGGSQIFAKEGQTFPLQTILAAVMIQSANDAAQALAEKIAGSSEAFADLMNDKARAMGLKNSMFYDPHGLPNKETGKDDQMSAADLAKLGMELMKYPLMREYAAMQTMPFTNATFTSGLTNPNHLLRFFGGAYGIKTGYTVPAGFCVTAGAKRGDLDLVAVVMGAKTGRRGPDSSFSIAARLMNEAFSNYRMIDTVKQGTAFGTAAVTGGAVDTVPVVAGATAKTLVKRGQEGGMQTSFSPSPLSAPVKRGQQVGTVVVKQGGNIVARVPAIASGDVATAPWWKKFWPF